MYSERRPDHGGGNCMFMIRRCKPVPLLSAIMSVCLAASVWSLPAQEPAIPQGALYQDSSAPLDARVKDLLERMTPRRRSASCQ